MTLKGGARVIAWSKCAMSQPVTPTAAQPVQGAHGRQEGERAELKGIERLEVGENVLK